MSIYMSEYELVALILEKDRFFMEVDDYGMGDLLTEILRTCHDLDNENGKYDANDLGEAIATLILKWTRGDGAGSVWPEALGSGWNGREEAEEAEKAPVLQPGELDPETGLYNPNEHPEPIVKPAKAPARKLSAVPQAAPVPRDLPPLEGLPTLEALPPVKA